MTAWGLPHSEIAGSSLLSSFPTLIAALHVLHRLWNQGIHLHALIYFRLRVNCTVLRRKAQHDECHPEPVEGRPLSYTYLFGT